MKKISIVLIAAFLFSGCAIEQGSTNENEDKSMNAQHESAEEKSMEQEKAQEKVSTKNNVKNKRARDAKRLADINLLVTAIEAYNVDNGTYPRAKGCLGNGDVFEDEIDTYFSNADVPKDPYEKRSGLTINPGSCISNGYYYYEYIGEVGLGEYMLMTVMEIDENNNIKGNSINIEGISTSLRENYMTCPESECDFYTLIK